MKYTLLKKWHPSQVEEVGHVFEEDTQHNLEYVYNIEDRKRNKYISEECLQPHEIALLCDAGYLEQESEKCKHEAGMLVYLSMPQKYKCKKCEEIFTEVEFNGVRLLPKWENYTEPQLDLWTELPPKGETYEFVTHYGDIDWAVSQENDWDKFRVKTKNCHKTHKSAEEALKRLLN